MSESQRQPLYVIPRAQARYHPFRVGRLPAIWTHHGVDLCGGDAVHRLAVPVPPYPWRTRHCLGPDTDLLALENPDLDFPILPADSSPDVLSVIKTAQVNLAIGAMCAIVIPVAYVFRRTRKLKDERNDLHGSAHWAGAVEIEGAGILPTPTNVGGVMLGAVDIPGKKSSFSLLGPKDQTVYLRHSGPEHILVFAPTRSGKGVGIVMPDTAVLVRIRPGA